MDDFMSPPNMTLDAANFLRMKARFAALSQNASMRFPQAAIDSEEDDPTDMTSHMFDGNELEAEKIDPKLIGMSVGTKKLYSGKEDRRGRFQWQDTIPQDVVRPAENAETQKWALIVRYVKASPPFHFRPARRRYYRSLQRKGLLSWHLLVSLPPLIRYGSRSCIVIAPPRRFRGLVMP